MLKAHARHSYLWLRSRLALLGGKAAKPLRMGRCHVQLSLAPARKGWKRQRLQLCCKRCVRSMCIMWLTLNAGRARRQVCDDPLEMYQGDLMTVNLNLAGAACAVCAHAVIEERIVAQAGPCCVATLQCCNRTAGVGEVPIKLLATDSLNIMLSLRARLCSPQMRCTYPHNLHDAARQKHVHRHPCRALAQGCQPSRCPAVSRSWATAAAGGCRWACRSSAAPSARRT